MTIGTCRIEFLIPGNNSLKGKRCILSSLKTQIRNRFNCSIAEVEDNDLWQKSVLAVAVVSNESKHADQEMAKIAKFIENDGRVQLLDYSTKIL